MLRALYDETQLAKYFIHFLCLFFFTQDLSKPAMCYFLSQLHDTAPGIPAEKSILCLNPANQICYLPLIFNQFK